MSTISKIHPATFRLILITGIAIFVIVGYWQSYSGIVDLWQHNDHRHGTLVFPITAFLIWRLRPQLGDLKITSEPLGLLVIAGLLVIWVTSRLAGIQVTEHATVLAMIPATIYTIAGREITRKLLFPLLFLILATPIGESLVPYLMRTTADISTAMLRVGGTPVLRDGQYISLPGGEFVVADVCSGVRYLITGIMIALLYSYLTYEKSIKRIIFTAVTAIVLVFANGVRAYLVMAIASATNMEYFGGRDHVYFGWLLFGIVIMTLMWIGGRYGDLHNEEGVDDPTSRTTKYAALNLPLVAVLGLMMLAVTVNPFQADLGNTGKYVLLVAIALGVVLLVGGRRVDAGDSDESGKASTAATRARTVTTLMAAAILLVVPPYAVSVAENEAPVAAIMPGLDTLPGCVDLRPWSSDWSPVMRDSDVEHAVTLTCDGETVSVYAAGYASALQGKELISGSNQLIPEAWDRYIDASKTALSAGDGGPWHVIEVHVDLPKYKGLIWYWYDIDGRPATNEFSAKALQVVALLRGRPAGGQVVLLETPISAVRATARERLEKVAKQLIEQHAAVQSEGGSG